MPLWPQSLSFSHLSQALKWLLQEHSWRCETSVALGYWWEPRTTSSKLFFCLLVHSCLTMISRCVAACPCPFVLILHNHRTAQVGKDLERPFGLTFCEQRSLQRLSSILSSHVFSLTDSIFRAVGCQQALVEDGLEESTEQVNKCVEWARKQ